MLREGRQGALRMLGARKESILAILKIVDMEFGGITRYLREYCRLGDRELEKLRKVSVAGA